MEHNKPERCHYNQPYCCADYNGSALVLQETCVCLSRSFLFSTLSILVCVLMYCVFHHSLCYYNKGKRERERGCVIDERMSVTQHLPPALLSVWEEKKSLRPCLSSNQSAGPPPWQRVTKQNLLTAGMSALRWERLFGLVNEETCSRRNITISKICIIKCYMNIWCRSY